MNKFDVKNWLQENKLTEVSRLEEKMSSFRDLEGKTVKNSIIRNDNTVQINFKDGTSLEFTNDGNASVLGEGKNSLKEVDTGIRKFTKDFLKKWKKGDHKSVAKAVEWYAGSVYGYDLPNNLHRNDVDTWHVKAVIDSIEKSNTDYAKSQIKSLKKRMS